MKFASLLAVTLALIALIGALLRLPAKSVPLTVYAYLFVQLAYTLTAFWGMREGAMATREYLLFFTGCLAASMLLMIVLAWQFGAVHPRVLGGFVWFGALAFSATSLCVARHYLLQTFKDGLPGPALVVLAQGFVLSVCGAVTLSTLAAATSPASSILRAGLGSFWAVLGMLSFVCALGRVRHERLWAELNLWLPATIGFAVFALLAFYAWPLQAEAAREPTRENIVYVEQAVEVCERRGR